jgi:hypothetical protein
VHGDGRCPGCYVQGNLLRDPGGGTRSPKQVASIVSPPWRRHGYAPDTVALRSVAPAPCHAKDVPSGRCDGPGTSRRVCPNIGRGPWLAPRRASPAFPLGPGPASLPPTDYTRDRPFASPQGGSKKSRRKARGAGALCVGSRPLQGPPDAMDLPYRTVIAEQPETTSERASTMHLSLPLPPKILSRVSPSLTRIRSNPSEPLITSLSLP